jgi:AraC-like DNA-binding protein
MRLSPSDLLQSLRIARVECAFIDIAENAGAHLLGDRRGFIHLCTEGQAFIDNGGSTEPIVLEAGDYCIQLGLGAPRICSSPDRRSRQSEFFRTPSSLDTPPVLRFGTGPRVTQVLSGAFHVTTVNPIMRALPRTIVVRKADLAEPGYLAMAADDIARTAQGPGGAAFMTCTFDILFMQAARAQIVGQIRNGLDVGSAVDRVRIPIALTLIHSHPDRDWTLAKLAHEVGVSRSTFAAEFHKVTGLPFLQYITRLRMTRAGDMLRWQPVSVSDVAYYVGYKSVASFTRAFRGFYGVTPAAYQRAQAPFLDNSVAGHMHWSPFLGTS